MTVHSKINCGGCIAKVNTDLNELLGEGNWSVDTSLPNKPLTFSDDADVDDVLDVLEKHNICLLYTSPSPRDRSLSRMPSSA